MADRFFLLQVVRSHPGGSSAFIARIYATTVHDFSSLAPLLTVHSPPPSVLAQFPDLVAEYDFEDLLHKFLRGSGVPCPSLFAAVQPSFSSLVPIDRIDTAAFRTLAFCWATTGTPHVGAEDHHQIDVYFVGPNDLNYHAESHQRQAYMAEGSISFRSCYRVARIPLVYIAELTSRNYPAVDDNGNPTEPYTLQQAIDHWLLVEICNGIGSHSIL